MIEPLNGDEAFVLLMWLVYEKACRLRYAEEREYPEYVDLGGEA